MRKICILLALAISLSASSFNIKRDNQVVEYNYDLKDGVYTLPNKKFFDSKVKVIIEYNNVAQKSEIENKYKLKDVKPFLTDTFIYVQDNNNIIDLFKKLSSEPNVKSVYPNWTSTIKKY